MHSSHFSPAHPILQKQNAPSTPSTCLQYPLTQVISVSPSAAKHLGCSQKMPVQCWVHWQLFGISTTSSSSFKTLHPSGILASASPESSGSSTSIVCLTSQPIRGVQVWQVLPPHPRLHLHACSSSAVSTQIPLLLQSGNEFSSEGSAGHLAVGERVKFEVFFKSKIYGLTYGRHKGPLANCPGNGRSMALQFPHRRQF